jgi:multiple sugar transport system ATP-binding protein
VISSVEPLGSYSILNGSLGGHFVKIRIPGSIDPHNRKTIRVTFDMRRLHLFDGDGRRL